MASKLLKLKNLMYYAGLTKKDFSAIKDKRIAHNRNTLIIFSLISVIGFGIMLILSSLNIGAFQENDHIYALYFGFFLVFLFVILFFGPKFPIIINIATYFFMVVLLGYGIYLAVIVAPGERTVSYIGILTGLSGLFLISPLGFAIIIILSQIVFTILISQVQSGELFLINFEDAVIFGLISIAIGIYLMFVKAARYNSERIANHLILKDQLTGIYNRRNYEISLANINDTNEITVILFDVNGLKAANDKLGHVAGDELIKASAECIDGLFGKYGKTYRIGGDEFVAIVKDKNSVEGLLNKFEQILEVWKGKYNNKLSISYGYVQASEASDKTIYQLVDIADKRMYASKEKFYQKKEEQK